MGPVLTALPGRLRPSLPGVHTWGPDCVELAAQLPTDIADVGAGGPRSHIGNVCGDLGGQLPTIGAPCVDTTGVAISEKTRSHHGPIMTTRMATINLCHR